MITFEIEPLSDEERAVIDTHKKVIYFGVVFKKQKASSPLNRHFYCEVEYKGSYTNKEISDIENLNKNGKSIIEELLMSDEIRFNVSDLYPRP